MRYENAGFRPLYHGFSAFMLNDDLAAAIEAFPDADRANCILTYGYIDSEAGLTLEVLAAGLKTEDGFRFFDGSRETRSFIRIGAVKGDEFFCVQDEEGDLTRRYAEKIRALEAYAAAEAVEKTRGMAFLDASRDAECVDDVLVFLLKDGLDPEGCWVRITDWKEPCFAGILLNEPYQDFGCHAGERIVFFAQQDEDGRIACCSDMDPGRMHRG